MKVSVWAKMSYLTAQQVPDGWPVPPAYYDRETGLQSYRHAIEQLELADALGFDWISFSEHHYSDNTMVPIPTLTAAAIAGRIKHAKLAIMGHVMPLNNPVRAAEELAMLDNLTEGRVVVGLMRGTAIEFQTFGVNPLESRDLTLEGIDLMLRAWTEPQPFSWEGRHFRYRTVAVWPKPLQEPHPPLYVLGASKEAGTYAARHHLKIGYALDRFEVFTPAYRHYLAECAEAGWKPVPDDIVYRGNIYVAESDEQAEADIERYWLKQTAGRGASVMQAVRKLDPAAPGHGMAGRPELTFWGGPDTIVRQVKQCQDACGAGIIDFIFQGPGLEHRRVLRSMELFGERVLPHIRGL
jgi:alkanesulfonate monooxygenase SsuD/methylene tetrahydromethanopterin reductase-like flavin-dependent oxidoreductase (luciferase family)